MKIIRQTSDQLTLKLYPWLSWVLSASFISGGLLASLSLGAHTLSCDRILQHCEIERSTLWRSNTEQFALHNLQSAELDTLRDGDGYVFYRVLLHTTEAIIPLTPYHGNDWSAHYHRVQLINTFIEDSEQLTLVVKQNDILKMVLIGVISIAGGIITMLVFGQTVTCDFNKCTQQFVLKRRGLFSTQVIQHPLNRIQGIRIEQETDGDGDELYRVCFVIRSGANIPLTSYYSSGRRSKVQIKERISAFLQLRSR